MIEALRSAGIPFITFLITIGCVQQPETEPLTTARMYSLLDQIVLEPNVSCETLQKKFGVEYLPLVETPAEVPLEYDETFVNTLDGNTLRTWYLPAAPDRGVVLLSYGAVGQMPCYLYTARILVANGWSVVLYDYRGFGGSSGSPQMESLAADLDAMIDWTVADTGHEQVTLMGISLGTIPTIAVAARRAEVVNGVILDSPVVLSMEVLRFKNFVGELATQIANLLPFDLLPEQAIEYMSPPALFFSHGRDFLAPPAMADVLYERAAGPKYLVEFDEIGHARGVFRDTQQYAIALESFLVRVWEGGEPPTTVIVP